MPQELIIVTPENAEIRVPLAGTFSRAAAFMHDIVLQFFGLLALQFLYQFVTGMVNPFSFGRDFFYGLNMLLIFIWTYGYYPFFELLYNGQTPGKKAHGIRVISSNGQRVRLFSSLLRNFLRIADFFPFMFFSGIVATLLTAQNQRLGDLFANTVVIRETGHGD